MITEYVVTVNTTGSAGAATGSGSTLPINGKVLAVKVDYHASAPATTKVDVDENGGMARKVLNKAASNTDATHYPRLQMQDTSGTPVAGIYEPIALAGRKLNIAVTASDQLTAAVVVTVMVEE